MTTSKYCVLYILLLSRSVLIFTKVFSPIGIPFEKLVLYDPLKNFTCLDGSSVFPFDIVNDDYCDCADGSDETSTPACRNGLFRCTNKGHVAEDIPTAWLNDGFCDCCDGSDEYSSSKVCDVTCELLHEQKVELQRTKTLAIKEGCKIKRRLMDVGKSIIKNKLEYLEILEEKVTLVKDLRKEAKLLKKLAEQEEIAAIQLFRDNQDLNQDECDTRLVECAFKKLDVNKDGVLQKKELNGLEFDDINIDRFKEIWSNYEKKYVKTIEDSISKGIGEEVEKLYRSIKYGVRNKYIVQPQYDEVTLKYVQKAKEARESYESSVRSLYNLELELNDVRHFLSQDYGPDEEFASLNGRCFVHERLAYTYELCPFVGVKQISRRDNSSISLGLWKDWAEGKNSIMRYADGDSCTGTGNMMTDVTMFCGSVDNVLSVVESDNCLYTMEFETPAACDACVPPVRDEL